MDLKRLGIFTPEERTNLCLNDSGFNLTFYNGIKSKENKEIV